MDSAASPPPVPGYLGSTSPAGPPRTLIAYTTHDLATMEASKLAAAYIAQLREAGHDLTILRAFAFLRSPLVDALSDRWDNIIYVGHGTPTKLHTAFNNPALTAADLDRIKTTRVLAVACHADEFLGAPLRRRGIQVIAPKGPVFVGFAHYGALMREIWDQPFDDFILKQLSPYDTIRRFCYVCQTALRALREHPPADAEAAMVAGWIQANMRAMRGA